MLNALLGLQSCVDPRRRRSCRLSLVGAARALPSWTARSLRLAVSRSGRARATVEAGLLGRLRLGLVEARPLAWLL